MRSPTKYSTLNTHMRTQNRFRHLNTQLRC